MSDKWIRLASPPIAQAEISAAVETLESGYLAQGEQVALLEKEVLFTADSEVAIAVGSGTAALHLSLLSLGITDGHNVATTTFAWPATANTIELVGATPVFVDIDPSSFNIDLDQLEATMTATRIAALLLVHSFGNGVNMTQAIEIARKHGIPVIEDAACAIGGKWNGKALGSFGDAGCFSFHPRKIVTSGEGGLVVTGRHDIATRIKRLRDHGASRGADGAFDFAEPGFNYRMTDIGAALLRPQLQKLPRLIAGRRMIAAEYDRALRGSRVISQSLTQPDSTAIQAYVVSISDMSRTERDHLIAQLRSEHIEASIATVHIPMTQYYSERYGYKRGDYPVTDTVSDSSLALPFHNSLSLEDVDRVAKALLDLV